MPARQSLLHPRHPLLALGLLGSLACGGPESELTEAVDPLSGPLPPCSAALKASLLATAPGDVAPVRAGHCQLDFARSDVLRPLRIMGAGASGLRINCNGARIERKAGSTVTAMVVVQSTYDLPTVEAEMLKAYDNSRGIPVAPYGVSRPEDVEINGCRISGTVQISGLGGTPAVISARSQSDTLNNQHSLRMRAMAPRRIHLNQLEIYADPSLGLSDLVYFHDGVSDSSLVSSTLSGEVRAVTLYLSPDGVNNTIQNNTFNVAHTADGNREIIAIDGASNNIISGNAFLHVEDGGIYLYRNCGESGSTRHQSPTGNQIFENDFYYKKSSAAAVWVGRRTVVPALTNSDSFLQDLEAPRTYCKFDEQPLTVTLSTGRPFTLARSLARLGSAADTYSIPVEVFGLSLFRLDVNRDGAAGNTIRDNRLLNYGQYHRKVSGTPVPPVYRLIDKFSEAVNYPGSDVKEAGVKFSGPGVEAANTQSGNSIVVYPPNLCALDPPPVTIRGVTREARFDPPSGLCYFLPAVSG